MDTIFLCVSAGSGPEECARTAALTVQVFLREIQGFPEADVKAGVIEDETSRVKGNIRSALLALEGKEAKKIANSWTGIVQWIRRSAYRPGHKRKNWFVSITQHRTPEQGAAFSPSEVRFETARSEVRAASMSTKRKPPSGQSIFRPGKAPQPAGNAPS